MPNTIHHQLHILTQIFLTRNETKQGHHFVETFFRAVVFLQIALSWEVIRTKNVLPTKLIIHKNSLLGNL